MHYIKRIGSILAILFLAVLIEIIRQTSNIPVTLLDLIFLPLFTFLACSILWAVFFTNALDYDSFFVEPASLLKKIGIFVFCVALSAGGISAIWIGLSEPDRFYSGVKGAVHGYTLVPLGLFLFEIGAFVIVRSIHKARIKKDNVF